MTTDIQRMTHHKRIILRAEKHDVRLELTPDGAGVRGTRENIQKVIHYLNLNMEGVIEALKEFESQECKTCRHRTPYATCGKPVEAGLTSKFEIRWPQPEYAKRCMAYSKKKIPQKDRDKYRDSQTNSMR